MVAEADDLEWHRRLALRARPRLALATALQSLIERSPEARGELRALAVHCERNGIVQLARSRRNRARWNGIFPVLGALQTLEHAPDRSVEPLVREGQAFTQQPVRFHRTDIARILDLDDEPLGCGCVGRGISHSMFSRAARIA